MTEQPEPEPGCVAPLQHDHESAQHLVTSTVDGVDFFLL